MNFLVRVFVIAAVSFALAQFLGGVHVTDFWTALAFAIILALINMFIRPLLVLFTLPVTIVTLGLFLFVINTLVVLLASRMVKGFTIDSFWWALLFMFHFFLIFAVFFILTLGFASGVITFSAPKNSLYLITM